MKLHQLRTSKWAATLGVTAGLIAYQAAAIDEAFVYATEAAVTAAPRQQDLQRDMDLYIEALNVEQKAKIDAALAERRAEIQIAAAKVPTRG